MTQQSPSLTADLAAWVVATAQAPLPEAVVDQTRRSVVDHLAAAMLGADTDAPRIVRDYLSATRVAGPCTVIGSPDRLDPAGAALANGTAAHALDLDDGYTPGGLHPGATVIPAALAVAEVVGATGDQLAKAIALGYEVACRLAGATHPRQRQRGFHNTAVAGVLGAATAAAVLWELDEHQLAQAWGLAASHSGGLLSFLDEGSDVKRLHGGKAARDGVVSVELTRRGFTGPTSVLESPHGYLRAFTGADADHQAVLGGLGTEWRFVRTYQKPYPCCRHLHSAIDAVLELRERFAIEPAQVEHIAVDTFAIAASHDDPGSDTVVDAQMSLPYCVAVALIHGEVGMAQFDEPARTDPQIIALASRISVTENPAYTAEYPASRPTRVSLAVADRSHEIEVRQPFGEPDNPMSDEALRGKFLRLVSPLIGQQPAERMCASWWQFAESKTLPALRPNP